MTISVVVTETNINASVTQLSNSVALTETSINASVTQTPIFVGVTTSPISASVIAASSISVSVTQTNISASISGGGGSGGVTDHALLTNLDYASAGHTNFAGLTVANIFTDKQTAPYFRVGSEFNTYSEITINANRIVANSISRALITIRNIAGGGSGHATITTDSGTTSAFSGLGIMQVGVEKWAIGAYNNDLVVQDAVGGYTYPIVISTGAGSNYVQISSTGLAIGTTQLVVNKTTSAVTMSGNVSAANLSGTNTGDITLGTANGLGLVGQVLSLGLASSGVTGALSGTDWDTFNNKQGTLTFPLAANLGGTGVANLVGSTLTLGGATIISTGGTIALGGFILTVPATGTAALLATANVFTTTQQVTVPTTTLTGLILKTSDNNTTKNLFELQKSTGTVAGGFDALGRVFSGRVGTLNFFSAGAGNATATGDHNIAIGAYSCMTSLTSGSRNIAMGVEAALSMSSGSYNIALGNQALRANTIAAYNMAIGVSALAKSGSQANTAVGYSALSEQTSGSENVGIGRNAGLNNQTGSGNISIGNFAGTGVATNSYSNNLFIGYSSGYSITTGSNNTFFGAYSGYRQTNASNLFIVDNQQRADVTEEQNLALMYGNNASPGLLQLNFPYSTNNAILEALKIQAYVPGVGGSANGFGVGFLFYAETASGSTYQKQGYINTSYDDSTNATRKSTLTIGASDTADRDGIKVSANGSAADVRLLGDTWWEGEGFGLPYGSCSSNDIDINWTQSNAAQNTWYDISDADMVDGQLNLVTHDGSGQLTVTKAGRYMVSYTIVAEASGANIHLESAISVSGTENAQGVGHAEFVTANAERELAGHAILDLAASATINISIRTTDASTPNIKVEMLEITLFQLGGT